MATPAPPASGSKNSPAVQAQLAEIRRQLRDRYMEAAERAGLVMPPRSAPPGGPAPPSRKGGSLNNNQHPIQMSSSAPPSYGNGVSSSSSSKPANYLPTVEEIQERFDAIRRRYNPQPQQPQRPVGGRRTRKRSRKHNGSRRRRHNKNRRN